MFCHTYLANTTILNNEDLFEYYYKQVSIERKQKIDALAFRNDKNNSLAVYILALRILKDNNIKEEDLYFIDHKPLIKNIRLFISFSHSGNYAMVAISDEIVACDVQEHDQKAIRIANKFYSEEEKLEMANSNNLAKTFFEIWSKKECLIKAYDIKDFRLALINKTNQDYIYHKENISGYSVITYCHKACDYKYKEIDLTFNQTKK